MRESLARAAAAVPPPPRGGRDPNALRSIYARARGPVTHTQLLLVTHTSHRTRYTCMFTLPKDLVTGPSLGYSITRDNLHTLTEYNIYKYYWMSLSTKVSLNLPMFYVNIAVHISIQELWCNRYGLLGPQCYKNEYICNSGSGIWLPRSVQH